MFPYSHKCHTSFSHSFKCHETKLSDYHLTIYFYLSNKYQSKNVKKVKGTNVVKGKLVVQWGVNVFEVVNGFYTCNTKNICRLTDYERVATYEKCLVKNQAVKCSKKISGEENPSSLDSEIAISPDGLLESETNSRESIDELSEDFGSSINTEATII